MDGVTFQRTLENMQAFSPLPKLSIGGYGEPLSPPTAWR